MSNYAIIVAGGKGLRMGSDLPKQFLHIHKKPVLLYTISRFIEFDKKIDLTLVLPKDHMGHWEEIKEAFVPQLKIRIVEGGTSRFRSVKNGLSVLPEEGFVAIHDGVRPNVSAKIIAESFQSAKKFGSGVAAVKLKESARKLTQSGSKAVIRDNYRLIQTPQTFDLKLLKRAFLVDEHPSFTDDATVFEADGNSVYLIEGDYKNLKITTTEDLLITEYLLANH
jgi:2-C-methyl-D-erythritol 4-phosphate cytidylyltransferase